MAQINLYRRQRTIERTIYSGVKGRGVCRTGIDDTEPGA
jgi:hypothetical protein